MRGIFLLGFLLALPPLSLTADTVEPMGSESEQTEGQTRRRPPNPDFLFGEPRASFAFRGGWSIARAGSDIFNFVGEQLTIEKSDFNVPTLTLDLALHVKPRLAAMFRFGYNRATIDSEFRDFVDQDDNPITQRTELTKIPLTGNLKIYLSPRGREISQYAWVPHSFAPYLGGGGGLVWYRFRQVGDFVDFSDLSIFTDTFQSEGWAGTLHVFGGVDVKLHKRVFLTVEACYAWAESELGQDFVDFDPIDLSGFNTTVGIDVVF